MQAQQNNQAKRLTILGLLLQALHVLFGITAIMGMFINHMLINKSKDTVYHSHIRWQLMTFWVCAALYTLTFFVWYQYGYAWPATIVAVFAFYRIATCAYYCYAGKPLERVL